MGFPVYDNHVHLSPRGRGIDALLAFKAAGGTGLTLVTLPYPWVRISRAGDFLDSFAIAESMAREGRERTGLTINLAVGPYPVLLLGLAERHGLAKAEEIMLGGMEIAAGLVREGRAAAIGEVGRPHFPVDRAIMEASDRILLRGMELARECDCPVIVHCESDEGTFGSLRELADRARLPPGMVVKHFSAPVVDETANRGIMPSMPASRKCLAEALAVGDRFMVETDYVDDPDNPHAVMAINTVPKRIKALHASGAASEETIWRICGDIPSRLYGRG
ncbi:MAG: metal-dependent hydrolase [Thermoplasmatales archaeon]|nr:metal-dependent hydrolase [Thermoplasmatales archaeon]